jgi:hypothetical protein
MPKEESGPTEDDILACPTRVTEVGGAYLDLQNIVASDALVMHIMISFIGIATILIFDKCEAESDEPACWFVVGGRRCLQSAAGRSGGRNVTADKTAIANTQSLSVFHRTHDADDLKGVWRSGYL